MYQSINKEKFTELEFEKLTKDFEENITNFKLDSLDIEFNINSKYIPNHACIWNNIHNINNPCQIIVKNNKLALVKFDNLIKKDDPELALLRHLYRLEDLSILE